MAKTKPNKPPVADISDDPKHPTVLSVEVTIPIVEVIAGYVTTRCDVRMTQAQAITLKQIENGLIAENARLENGKYVASGVDAFKYWLEMVASK